MGTVGNSRGVGFIPCNSPAYIQEKIMLLPVSQEWPHLFIFIYIFTSSRIHNISSSDYVALRSDVI
jgi:hypothetical protein